jgi:hypothetical protein
MPRRRPGGALLAARERSGETQADDEQAERDEDAAECQDLGTELLGRRADVTLESLRTTSC